MKNKSIAIVGLGNSFSEYILAKIRSEKFDEVWAINSMSGVIYHDKCFMMDPPSRFLDTPNAGKQTNIMADRLKTKINVPIFSCVLDKRCPDVVEYPLQNVLQKTKYAYLNNTVAYALAYAIAEEVSDLHLFGIDFTHKAINFAEAGRACCEFWLAIAVSKGIKLHIANSSSLLDTNVSEDQKLYGYHRLDDPLVSTTTQGEMLITKKSKLEPPEPLDATPNLIGREDIPGVTYEEKKNV
jgi:hypothetical protein|tara:strand:+ start:1086 stop:1805 length:720 start_codon:yes stop_codon:yes gene_type:complete